MSELDALVDTIFSNFDEDGNGSLDASEARKFFDQLFSEAGETISNENHEKIYASVDTDGDNKLSKDELRDILHAALNS